MTTLVDVEIEELREEKPGAQLSAVRRAKGLSIEYVATQLHLRVCVIELIEADDYVNLPDPVFVKGYLRAYSKLMDVNPDPFIEIFNRHFCVERQSDKALWQSRRESSRAERSIRWLTALFGIFVLIAVAIWWYKSQENQNLFSTTVSEIQKIKPTEHAEADIRLTDLSKMRSLLSSVSPYDTLENKSE